VVTTVQLATLENALASGTTRVTFNGRTVDYGTVDQLLKAIQYVKGELNSQNGIVSSRQVRTYTSKGLGPNSLILNGFERE
jgi:hypothetical protein